MKMHPVAIAGIVIISGSLLFGIGYGFVSAGQDEIQRIKDRITQLQSEIQRNSSEYAGISATMAEDRAHCDLAAAKEVQLSRLNGSNNAKRTEIEVLESLLQKDDPEVGLGK